MYRERFLVAVDIGTTKVAVLICKHAHDQDFELVGYGVHPSNGLKRGVVVNIESTVQAIQAAVSDAEAMAGTRIDEVVASIAGSHVGSLNSHGIVAIRSREVQQVDLEGVIEAAQAVAIPADQKVLHILPQEFMIDDQGDVRDPIGMSGVRLEAKVHIVTCADSATQNIMKCLQRCGLYVKSIILEQLASSYAVLLDDEKELGVCILDIGGGTTDIAVFIDGTIRHSAVIPIAGDQVTNDIAIALRTPTKHAEEIKINHAFAFSELLQEDATINVPSMGKRAHRVVSKKALAEVVEARYQELLMLVFNELKRKGFDKLIPAGFVITGGASKVRGIQELAEKELRVPVRMAVSRHMHGDEEIVSDPAYATGVGLVLYHHQQQQGQISGKVSAQMRSVKGVFRRLASWLEV